jgi:Cu+-exporting ATPase
LAALAGLRWYFFAPRRASVADLTDGVQRIPVTVHRRLPPRSDPGPPGRTRRVGLRSAGKRDYTSGAVFGDLALSAALRAFTRTTVRLQPEQAGTFGFACGMNMIHGTLVVDPAHRPVTQPPSQPSPAARAEASLARAPAEAEAGQAAERRAELRDLTRRVLVDAVLTAPLLFAVMARELFKADWCLRCCLTTGCNSP